MICMLFQSPEFDVSEIFRRFFVSFITIITIVIIVVIIIIMFNWHIHLHDSLFK